MLFTLVVAPIAGIHLLAAAEAEPAVTLGVVPAAAAFGQLGAGSQAEDVFLAARAGGGRQAVEGRDAQELGLRDREGEFLMALSADVACALAAHGNYA